MSSSDSKLLSRWPQRGAAACIGAAAIWAWIDVPQIAHPMGSDWAQYFTVAEILWHDDPHLYPPFRKPLYGLLLGLIGEPLGYLPAAQFIGRASAALMVLAAGLGAWALVGPLAAAVAALCVVLMPLVMDGALWVNNYPLLSACCAMALGAGAALSRWPRLKWALLSGLSAGAAVALDVRGLMVVPAVVLLLLIGLPWSSMRKSVALVLALAAPIGALHAYDAWLTQAHAIPQFTLDAQTQRQRQAVLEPIRRGQYVDAPELQAACLPAARAPTQPPPWLHGLKFWAPDSCAEALRQHSAGPLQDDRHLPNTLTLWLLPLVLLPLSRTTKGGGSRWKSTAASAVFFGIPLIAVFIGMGWVFYYDRYLLPLAGVMAVAVPVALGRLATLTGRWAGWARWAAAASAMAWALWIWPGHDARSLQAPEEVRSADFASGVVATWADTVLQDGDRVYDCGGLAFDYLLLPKQIDYTRHPPGAPECDALARRPGEAAGQTYLITPLRPGDTSLMADATAIAALGWLPLPAPADLSGYRIWHR